MKRRRSIPIILLLVLFLAVLLSACTGQEPVETPAPPASTTADPTVTGEAEEATVPVLSPEPDSTTAPDEEEAQDNAAPEDEITAEIISGDFAGAGKPFTFDATQSAAGDLAIVGYEWDMGDGATLFGQAVEHVYSVPGLYTVTLTITAKDGGTASTSKVVEVILLEDLSTRTAEDEDPTSELEGTGWVMDNAMRGTTITLEFEELTLSGSSGCNTYNASYSAAVVEGSSTSISVSSIATTKKACTPEIMAQEKGYLDSLSSAKSYTIKVTSLILVTGSGTLTFSESIQ